MRCIKVNKLIMILIINNIIFQKYLNFQPVFTKDFLFSMMYTIYYINIQCFFKCFFNVFLYIFIYMRLKKNIYTYIYSQEFILN
jgi:hypothetical protein